MPIRWTKAAADDLCQISDYTLEHFGAAQARRAALTIFEAVEALEQFPRRGRTGRAPGTREIAIPGYPFLVIYRVGDDFVEVVRILHGARRWP